MTTATEEKPKLEKLRCQHKRPHDWTRPAGIRGRKPVLCPKHTPEKSTGPLGPVKLHCQLGNHDWMREPAPGRLPANCPEHKPVSLIQAAPRNENGMVTLHCEKGNHDWERPAQPGRKPVNCPKHSATAVVVATDPVNKSKRGGRPKKYDTKEEQAEAQLKASRARVDELEGALKTRGSHLSQQSPYTLYKKIGETQRKGAHEPTTEWERVEEHSPLRKAQYVEAHAAEFEAGNYRYERAGKVVVL